MTSYLFIYGTLLTGTGNPGLDRLVRQHLEPLGEATIQGKLYDLGHYPGAVPSHRTTDRISGILCLVRQFDVCIPKLDRYEGCDRQDPARGDYRRQTTDAILQVSAQTVTTWVYFYQKKLSFKPRIRHGDYRRFRPGRQTLLRES